jgi:hypothetical protein
VLIAYHGMCTDRYSTDQLQLNKPLLNSGCGGVDTDTRTIQLLMLQNTPRTLFPAGNGLKKLFMSKDSFYEVH